MAVNDHGLEVLKKAGRDLGAGDYALQVAVVSGGTGGGSSGPTQSNTQAKSSVAAAITTSQLLAANPNRLGFTIFNDSTADLKISLGDPASATNFTVKVRADGYYEQLEGTIFTGAIHGIWSAANGAARITELT